MSTVQQLLNVLKKTFYDLTPVSNKQMSLMPMANGGIGFVNTKPINYSVLHCWDQSWRTKTELL